MAKPHGPDPAERCIDCAHIEQVDLGQVTSSDHIRLDNIGHDHARVSVTWQGDGLGELRIVDAQASVISLPRNPECETITVESVPKPVTMEIAWEGIANWTNLNIVDADVALRGRLLGTFNAHFERCRISGDQVLSPAELVIVHSLEVELRALNARVTAMGSSETSIESHNATIELGHVKGPRGSKINLRGSASGGVLFSSLPHAAIIDLDSTGIRLHEGRRPERSNAAQDHRAFDGIEVRGDGDVEVRGLLRHPRFHPSGDGEIRLSMAAGAVIDGGSGTVSLESVTGATIRGSRGRTPLRLARIDDVTGSELDNVSLYELTDISSVKALNETSRLRPWIPSFRAARRLQLAQDARLASATNDRYRPVRYWTELANAVVSTEASGSVQSQIRLSRMRALRRATDRATDRRGWWLLHAYAMVGYGERLIQPLVVWLLAVAVVAAGLLISDPVARSTYPSWKILGMLAGAPLIIFRVDAPRISTPGPWDSVGVALCRITGIITLGVIGLALTRILRPPSDQKAK